MLGSDRCAFLKVVTYSRCWFTCKRRVGPCFPRSRTCSCGGRLTCLRRSNTTTPASFQHWTPTAHCIPPDCPLLSIVRHDEESPLPPQGGIECRPVCGPVTASASATPFVLDAFALSHDSWTAATPHTGRLGAEEASDERQGPSSPQHCCA